MSSDEVLFDLRTQVALIKASLDDNLSHLRLLAAKHEDCLYGTPIAPGLTTKVDRLELGNRLMQWSVRCIWALVTGVGAIAATLLAK